ncbi:MAG TPA: hypothetical protein VET26_05485 [Candidatus Sulfotelmatobacter sp.]|nr:hypothetical protein [Candidatus Sulfotelmatobacter sp.]
MPKGAPAFKFENLLPYYSGAYYATTVIKGRLAAAGHLEEARELTAYQDMLLEFRNSIQETARLREARQEPAKEPGS